MPIKDWIAGENPSAADLNRYFMQQAHIIKTVEESVSNSTVLQSDNELLISVKAGTDYFVKGFITYEGAAQADGGDLKFGWLVPTGSTFDWVPDTLQSTATATIGNLNRAWQDAAGTHSAGTTGLGSIATCLPAGLLRVGSTDGVFQFQWAQLSATSVVSTRVKVNSALIIRRLTT